MSASDDRTVQAFEVRIDLHVEASTARVWQAVTEQGREWWPERLYVGKSPKGFVVEPHVGGRVFEDWGNGEGMLHGTVTSYREGEFLEWAGDRDADRGGPARSVTTFTFAPDGTGTRVGLRESVYGWVSDRLESMLERDWRFLLDGCFKPFVEQSQRPHRPETVE